MNISSEFCKSKNIFTFTSAFLKQFLKSADDRGVKIPVPLDATGMATFMAPAALIAQAISNEFDPSSAKLKVLIASQDKMVMIDKGMWLSFAKEMLGDEYKIDLFSTSFAYSESNIYSCAKELGLQEVGDITIAEAEAESWDLMIWLSPALEMGFQDELACLAASLKSKGTTVIATMYNELDAIIQSYAISPSGYEFEWLNGSMRDTALSKSSLNRYGIATEKLGIEGGWGAVFTRLAKSHEPISDEDRKALILSARITSLEGAKDLNWGFGDKVDGVAFGKYEPVGLIGNLAADRNSGFLLKQCFETQRLKCIGHLPAGEPRLVPRNSFLLAPWGARTLLIFKESITKEASKRSEAIELMQSAFDNGLIEAGIALARSYESIGTESYKAKANELYAIMDDSHYMSAYACAHKALGRSDESECLRLLTVASAHQYPPAMTDLGLLHLEKGDTIHGVKMITAAAAAGDVEAKFRLGEMSIQAGNYEDAFTLLRDAWNTGHAQALELSEWLCTQLIGRPEAKASLVKRELKDIKAFKTKIKTIEAKRQRKYG
tara:strand:+ start:16117 stop:17766 length:1650 start_codon:yes stop_codon:yes gene_type:complete